MIFPKSSDVVSPQWVTFQPNHLLNYVEVASIEELRPRGTSRINSSYFDHFTKAD
jgi:hypothetical protein